MPTTVPAASPGWPLFDLDKPVIAVVNGLAVDGCFELTLACDLVVATEHAQFFLPEVKIGVIPGPTVPFAFLRGCPDRWKLSADLERAISAAA